MRSERNMRPAIGAKNPATEPDLDLSQNVYASVLCNSSVLSNPVSILKSTFCEGAGLSNIQTQHASGAAPTTRGSALTVSALDTGLQAPTQPSTHPGTFEREACEDFTYNLHH